REVALMLAIAVDEPDVPALVAAVIAEERELPRVGRPARRDTALGAGGELEELLSLDRCAVDLEVAGLVPGERDLVAARREIDRAERPVDVRRAGQVLDRDALEARADRLRRELPLRGDDVGRRVRQRRRGLV